MSNKNLKVQFWVVLAGVSLLSKPVFAQEAEAVEALPADAPVRAEAQLSDEELKALRELKKDYERFGEVRKILAEKPRLSTTEQKKEAENVLRLRLNAGATGSNTLGFNAHVGANGLMKLKLSDSKSEEQGRRRVHVKTIIVEEVDSTRTDTTSNLRDDRTCERLGVNCKDTDRKDVSLDKTPANQSPRVTEKTYEEEIDSSVRRRSYADVEVGFKAGVHSSGIPAAASARGEYRGDLSFAGDKVSLGGGVSADIEENHNPLGPKYGSETLGVRGKIGVANDLLVLSAGAGLGEVHVPGVYGIGLRAHSELALDVAKALKKVCSDDQECAKVSLRYDFFRNIPSASNIHRAKLAVNVPVTSTTSVEGAFQVTDQAALSSDLIKRTDFAGTLTYNGSFDLYQLWDGADQAKRVMNIVQAGDGK